MLTGFSDNTQVGVHTVAIDPFERSLAAPLRLDVHLYYCLYGSPNQIIFVGINLSFCEEKPSHQLKADGRVFVRANTADGLSGFEVLELR